MRRSISACVKFLSRLSTALNLLPSIAAPASPQPTDRAAQCDKMSTNFADGSAIVLAEVGNRLVIGYKTLPNSHITSTSRPALALKPPTRLNPIEIALDVKLQPDRER